MSSKRLVVLRHAKSSWANADLSDHDRPLNARGRRAARLVGDHLRARGFRPDLVLCSSARRARQTLELLDLPATTEVLVEDGLYGADAGQMLARLRAAPEPADSVLLVGHNPGVEELARMLAVDRLNSVEAFPTAALADLAFPASTWADLQAGTGRLAAFVRPRDLDQAGPSPG